MRRRAPVGDRKGRRQEDDGLAVSEPTLTAGDEGLCLICRHRRLQRSARSVFVRCALGSRDGEFPIYPRLPVVACPGFDRQDTTS
jgi:hypothetical protein